MRACSRSTTGSATGRSTTGSAGRSSSAEQLLERVGQVVDAPELGDDDRRDPPARLDGDLREGDLVRSDAGAVVLDQEVGQLARGDLAVRLAGLAGEDPARREAVAPQ